MKRVEILLATISILLLLLLPSACAKSDGSFGIYLVDSDEIVLSQEHLKAYHSLDTSFELNAQGIEKWNSFHTYQAEPKLAQSLYQRDFILKIDGNEVCRGKFYSMVSSASYNGVVIMDSIMKLEGDRNVIGIYFGYVQSIPASEETRIKTEFEDFFSSQHLLVAGEG